jgi:putative transposase
MPYEYRKLTPKERKEVVESRQQRGYPLHAPPHPYRENGTYLITAANFEHQEIMTSSERRTEFQELLLNGFHEIAAEIIGRVILPNHYHILVGVESLNLVSDIVKLIHGRTSHDWNLQEGLRGKRKVWYRFFDRLMRDEKQLNQTLNYIHYNPVKHGCVKDVYDWPWSSIFLYDNEMGKEWLREQWKIHIPPIDYGKDWDI